MKDIFIESVNRYNGLDDTRKDAIVSLYRTLFEADESKEKKEEPKAENKEEKKEEKKDDKKADITESSDGDFRIKKNRTPINVTQSPNRQIKYIALHYTAGASSKPGSASRTVFPGNCSAEFIVDDGEIYQFSPDLDNYYCHAVGVKKKDYEAYLKAAQERGTHGAGALIKDANNKNTISIEMCSNFNGTITKKTEPYDEGFTLSEATLANTAKLVAYLLQKYPDAQIVRHFDITGKPCPGPWTRDDKGTAAFNAFVNRCKSTPAPGEPEVETVEDALMPKDERPPWPDFGRFFDPDNTATQKPNEEEGVLDISNGDVVNTIKKAVGNPIGNTLIDVITKNSGKVSPYVVKDFVTMITQPKNKEMLKNVLKLVSNQ